MQSAKTPSTRRSAAGQSASDRDRERLAFTLIELLIAIAIIGILAGLILTVAGGASIKATQRPGLRRHSEPGDGNCRLQGAAMALSPRAASRFMSKARQPRWADQLAQ